jgi:uncharacterized protein YrrD
MAMKQAAIGAKVKTKDGEEIGRVEKLIYDAGAQRLVGIVADKGIFDSGHVVNIEFISSMEEDMVELSITKDEAEQLPALVNQEFVQMGDMQVGGMRGGMVNVSGSGGSWTHVGSNAGGGMATTGAGSFFQPAIIGNVETQLVGPLTDSDIAVGNNTHIQTSDGKKIGVIDDVIMDDTGKIVSIICEKGRLFHSDLTIPVEWIAGVAHDHIRLYKSEAEVEAEAAKS